MAWAVDVTTEDELRTAVGSSNTDIKLMGNIALSGTLEINRATQLTIDLNGHNITADGFRAIHIKQGKVTITSDSPAMISAEGSVPVDNSVIRLGDGAEAIQGTKNAVDFTLGENVTVSTTVETCYGITVFGGSTTETLTVNGKVKTTGRSAVSGNGNAWNNGTIINIGEKAEISTTSNVAIYHPQDGTLTVSGKVTGAGGIEIKAGKLEVTATAKITATGAISHTPNNNDPSTCGYAIAIVENEKYTAGVSEVKISKDATIEGPIAVLKDSENANTQNVQFTGDVKMLVKVTTIDAKSFGQYLSLELAMSQAPADATITLLNNVAIASTIETSKGYTLDLNGKTITSDGQRALWIKSGEVTIKSTAESPAIGKIEVPTATNHDSSVIRVGSDESAASSLTIEEGVTISADECYGITVFGKNTTETLIVEGNVNTKIRPAISGNGSAGLASTNITIGSTANIITTDNVAIYHPQAGTLTVDGTVTGAGGVEIKGGELKVGEHATITATGTPTHIPNNNDPSTRGYSIAIVENGQYAGVSAVTIDNAATLVGPVAQLKDSDKDGFSPSYSGNAVAKKVAAIGNDEYFTVHDAITIVPSQGTVKLIYNDPSDKNLTVNDPIKMDVVKTYTLDLNGMTLTGNGCAALQITNGHITLDGATDSKVTVSGDTAPQAAILMGSIEGSSRSVSLTINKDVTVDGGTLTSGILLAGDMTRETLIVNGTVAANGHNAIIGSKDPKHGGTSITIARTVDENGDVVSQGKVEATNAVAIYHPQSGDLIVEGTIEGKGTTAGAIEMKGGDLTVMEGATVKAVGTTIHNKNNDAPSTNGYAIALVENPAFTGVGRVNINDGANVTGVIACLIDDQNNSVAEPLFTGDVYMIAETNISNGRGDKYAKLNDAIAEAPASTPGTESVVKLLDDLTVTNAVTISKPITFDMDDYSIINNQTSGVAMTVSADAIIKNGGIVSGKTGEPAVELNNAGISVTGGTIALLNMTVSTKGVALSVSGGTVSADQKSSFSSNNNNTVALSAGTLTMAGKVLNTSAESPAIAGSGTGALTVTATATISSATSKAINWASTGDLTISGGKIAGTEAVYAENGNLTISGGTLTGIGNSVNIASNDCTPSITGGTFYCGESGSPIAAVSGKEHFVSGTNTYFSVAINPDYCQLGYMVSPTPKNNGLFYLIDEIVIYDGVDWSSPGVSRINKAKYIRNSGMGASGTRFGTLCLPFSFTPGASGTTIPTGMKFYEVTSINSAKSEITITELNGEIAAGTPVVFQFESAASEFTIESTNANIATGDAGSGNNLVGTFTKTELTASTTPNVNDVYYLNSDAFHKAKESLTVPAFRAYIKFDNNSGSARPDVLNIFIEDETDDLQSVMQESAEEMIFDLQGNLQDELKPGMNIVKMSDGRTIKVYVK